MRHQNYFQYFEEFIENNQAYFCELLSLFVEKIEDPNSHYSRIPSDTQDFIRLSRIDYRMSTEQNKEGKFIYINWIQITLNSFKNMKQFLE